MFPGTTDMNIFVLPDLNLQKAFFVPNQKKLKISILWKWRSEFLEVPDKEWLTDLLRKGHNTQLLNIRNHWTKEILVDGIHHMLN